MNINTGEVKKFAQLTEEEKKSSEWLKLPEQFDKLSFQKMRSKSDVKREAYMRRVSEKKLLGENV